jgi:hypothetical protein
MFVAQVDPE